MEEQLISIEDAAQSVPCDVQTLRQWLQHGHITGQDSFGRRDKKIAKESTNVMVSVDSLNRHCAKIGVKPDIKTVGRG